MSQEGTASTPPGWYPDPWRQAPYRWWNGHEWTGNVSPAPNVRVGPIGGSEWKFIGGMNVPAAVGRLNATVPLAALRVTRTTLSLVPRLFGSWMFTHFEVPVSEITAAFRLRGRFMTSGVGFELTDGQVAYFWTLRDQDAVLGLLQSLGVHVDPDPRPARKLLPWSGRRSTVATTPGLSRPLVMLAPLFMLIGIAIMVVFVVELGPFGWFVAVIGAVGFAQSFVLWQRSRRR